MDELQKIIDKSERIVFFGGAGVSTESGIPDFRSADGLYNMKYDYPPETVLSHTFFELKTEIFFNFYREKILSCSLSASPNAAHRKLTELERVGKLSAIVTQNIDGLHTFAGSQKVYELHGSIHRNFCTLCNAFYSAEDVAATEGVPRCSCGGVIKPDVVLYEEALDEGVVRGAVAAISEADTLIIAGTGMSVYPAAGLADYFRGNNLVVINMSPISADSKANLLIKGKVGEALSKITI